jgi:hypothetical protein
MTQPTYQTITGGFPLGHHLEMVMDLPRVTTICRAVEFHAAPEKSFIELGTGAGLFLEHARHIYADVTGVEKDPVVLGVARRTMSAPGPSNWELVAGDAREVVLSKYYDVALCEMLSTWCIVEPQVSVIRAAKQRLLHRAAKIIPSRIINLLELGYVQFGVGPVSLPTPHLTLMGVRAPTIMSLSQVASVIDFTGDGGLGDEAAGSVVVELLVGGAVNCVRLTSLVELAPGINWYSSDTLMPPIIYPLVEAVNVRTGTVATVDYTCEYGQGLDRTEFRLRTAG